MQPQCDSGLIVRLRGFAAAEDAGCQFPCGLLAAAAKIALGLRAGRAVADKDQHLLSLQGQLHTFGLVCLSHAKPGWR